eukprot:8096946-Pyramimonas_sp.AAC.1
MHSVRPLADVNDLKRPLCSQVLTRRDTLLCHVKLRCAASVEARAQALQIPTDRIVPAVRAARPETALRRPAAHHPDGDARRVGRGGRSGNGGRGRQAQEGRGRGRAQGQGRGR